MILAKARLLEVTDEAIWLSFTENKHASLERQKITVAENPHIRKCVEDFKLSAKDAVVLCYDVAETKSVLLCLLPQLQKE
jgi:hypothetical protein